jgi:hypothetical protein
LSPEDLIVVTEPIEAEPGSFAINYLAKLSYRFASAREQIISLSRSTKDFQRMNSICCLTRRSPRELKQTVLEPLSHDTFKPVRERAIWAAIDLHCRYFADSFGEISEREKDSKMKKLLEYAAAILKQGFVLEKTAEGNELHVLCYSGCVSTNVHEAELAELGIQNIVKQWRKFKG